MTDTNYWMSNNPMLRANLRTPPQYMLIEEQVKYKSED